MIILVKGQANDVVVTLYEKTTIDPDLVYYLFEFQKADTRVSYFCIPTDTSQFINRYNEFSITETTNPDPLAGEVELDKGEYHYFVYEQLSDSTLDPTGLTLVESGIARVMTTAEANSIYATAAPEYQVYGAGK